MYTLKLKTHFSAAHQLTNAYSKECNDFIHGHNWDVEIIIKTDELNNNMVVDFKILKEIVNKLDHRMLNEILDFEPTAERLAKHIADEIYKRVELKAIVTIWEADNASITYEN